MAEEKITKDQEEGETRPMPDITPDMIRITLEALEAKGMVQYNEGGYYLPTEKGWKLLTEAKPTKEEIIAYGHQNITATHTTTFEITKAKEMKKEADCIIAVKADKACNDLSEEVKDALKGGRKIEITLEADGVTDRVTAYGSPALRLTHHEDIVVRKSDFIDSRTLAILADKSANEIKQELIEKLRDGGTQIKITLEVK